MRIPIGKLKKYLSKYTQYNGRRIGIFNAECLKI